MSKSKLSMLLPLFFVFLSGVVMGAVAYRLYLVKTVASSNGTDYTPRKRMRPDEMRKLILSRLKDAVRLNDQESNQVQTIYEWQGDQFTQLRNKYQSQIDQIQHEAETERDKIHEAAVARIRALLSPDQQPLYSKWLAERAAHDLDRKRRPQMQDQKGSRNEGVAPSGSLGPAAK